MKIAVVVFPGSNCDSDMHYAIRELISEKVEYVFHKKNDLSKYDAVILPGGFSYGDYLRKKGKEQKKLEIFLKNWHDSKKKLIKIFIKLFGFLTL